MATSHEIGTIAANQISMFGNSQAFSRQASPNLVPFGGGGGGMPAFNQQQTPSFGFQTTMANAFTPMGPAFAPAGSFPGSGLQRTIAGVTSGGAQLAAAAAPGGSAFSLAGGMAGAAANLGVGGMVAGAGIGMGAGAVADYYGGVVTETFKNMSALTNSMQSQRFLFGGAPGAGPSGAFSPTQVGQMSVNVMNMATSSVLTDFGSVRRIMNQLAEMGLFQIARDMPDVMRRMGETMRALKDIAVSAQTTMEGALPIFAELRTAGFTQAKDMGGVVQQMAAGQRAGVTMDQQMQAGMTASQGAIQAGVAGAPAFEGAAAMTRNLGISRQQGMMSEEAFMRITLGTGEAQVAANRFSQANLGMATGPLGLVAGAAFGGALSGPSLGTMPFGAMMQQAVGNVRSPADLVGLINRQDVIAGQLIDDPLAMARMAQSMGKQLQLPGSTAQNTQLILNRVMGMGAFESREMTRMLQAAPRIQAIESAMIYNQQALERAQIKGREMRPDIVLKRMSNQLWKGLMSDSIFRTMTRYSTGAMQFADESWRNFVGLGGLGAGQTEEDMITAGHLLMGDEAALAESLGAGVDVDIARGFGSTDFSAPAPGTIAALFRGMGAASGSGVGGAQDLTDISVGRVMSSVFKAKMERLELMAGVFGGDRAGGVLADLSGGMFTSDVQRNKTAQELYRFALGQQADPSDMTGVDVSRLDEARQMERKAMLNNKYYRRMSDKERIKVMHTMFEGVGIDHRTSMTAMRLNGAVDLSVYTDSVEDANLTASAIATDESDLLDHLVTSINAKGSTNKTDMRSMTEDPRARVLLTSIVQEMADEEASTGNSPAPEHNKRDKLADIIKEKLMASHRDKTGPEIDKMAREQVEDLMDGIMGGNKEKILENLGGLRQVAGNKRFEKAITALQAMSDGALVVLGKLNKDVLTKSQSRAAMNFSTALIPSLRLKNDKQRKIIKEEMAAAAILAYSEGEGSAKAFTEMFSAFGMQETIAVASEQGRLLKEGGGTVATEKGIELVRDIMGTSLYRGLDKELAKTGGIARGDADEGSQAYINRNLGEYIGQNTRIMRGLAEGMKLVSGTGSDMVDNLASLAKKIWG